jgi:hypothetical protein
MNVMPTGQDLDGNSTMDFIYAESTSGNISVAGGVMTIIDGEGGSDYVGAEGATNIWPAHFSSGDYTVEFSAKVLTVVSGSTGSDGAFQLWASNAHYAGLKLRDTGTYTAIGEQLSTASTMYDFHTYRLAKQGELFNVWRDGVSIGSDLAWWNNAYAPALYFGDGGGAVNGSTAVDYVRFTAGAYAPVPEPSSIVIVLMALAGLLAYAWRQRR